MSVFRPGLFAGKVAFVTGGGTGIGKAISHELLTLGCKVVIASRKLDRLQQTSSDLARFGEIVPVECNIREEESVSTAVKSALGTFGKIDFLVNNGGGQFPGPAESFKLKGWNAVIETNLTGTYLMSREVYRQYFRSHGGAIVNIIADMFRGFPMMAHTGAARAAVDNLTKSLCVEWAEDGVRINAVAPGVIWSTSARDNYASDVLEMSRPHLPSKRLGTPQEISSAVCFLLSPGASFISGATLKVDCGSSLYARLMWEIPDHEKLPAYEWSPDNDNKSKL